MQEQSDPIISKPVFSPPHKIKLPLLILWWSIFVFLTAFFYSWIRIFGDDLDYSVGILSCLILFTSLTGITFYINNNIISVPRPLSIILAISSAYLMLAILLVGVSGFSSFGVILMLSVFLFIPVWHITMFAIGVLMIGHNHMINKGLKKQ